MKRPHRNVTPGFRGTVPYDPVTGAYAQLYHPGITPYCAMMQVIEEDTHENYVVCRGYDPSCRKFILTLNVAKPYEERGTYNRYVGEIYAAVKPLTKLGTTSGVAATSTGQPADLDEEIEILYDDDGNPVVWMFVTSGSSAATFLGVVSTSGGITAANWAANPPVLGQGTVQPYDLDQENIPELVCPSGGEPATETWYNMAPVAILQHRGVVSSMWQGVKLIIVETCNFVYPGCA